MPNCIPHRRHHDRSVRCGTLCREALSVTGHYHHIDVQVGKFGCDFTGAFSSAFRANTELKL
jgi:hypothetical protein